MPVTESTVEEITEVPVTRRVEVIEQVVTRTRDSIGASDRMPVRVIVLFIVAIACATLAQVPFNIIGVAAIVLLALDDAQHRR